MTNEVPNPGWLIGTICYMDQEKIRLRASRSDFSDRMLDGEPRHLNGLNQYLFSYLSISTKIIFRVTSVEEAERPYSDQPSSRFSTSYIFTAVPIGEIEGSSYVPGVVDLPMSMPAMNQSSRGSFACGKESRLGPSLVTIQ